MNLFFKLWLFEKKQEKGKFQSAEELRKEAEILLSQVKAADSELSQIEAVLQQMKELTELAAKKSATQRERLIYQKQIEQLKIELSQIERKTI